MKRLITLAVTALLLNVGTVSAGPYEDATAAFERGDFVDAARVYQVAASQGNAGAQYALGAMSANGQGVAQSFVAAAKWYRLAAEQGEVRGQNALAAMYAQGNGVTQDYVRAHMWANLGAVSGSANAMKVRDIVAKVMTPQQIAQAQQMAHDCQARNFKKCD